MTSLNAYIDPQEVIITMDTLGLEVDGQPAIYTSKIFPLPHLRGVLCGTGSIQLIWDWYKQILMGMLALDLTHVDRYATPSLQSLAKLSEASQAPTTMYHFGYD